MNKLDEYTIDELEAGSALDGLLEQYIAGVVSGDPPQLTTTPSGLTTMLDWLARHRNPTYEVTVTHKCPRMVLLDEPQQWPWTVKVEEQAGLNQSFVGVDKNLNVAVAKAILKATQPQLDARGQWA